MVWDMASDRGMYEFLGREYEVLELQSNHLQDI
jgi:hypothetical protein